mmetsp:Transcript_8327/g.19465  ORF Transcript_8327/g.19465 Transcript_8327/m.19465 type:complete len:96 (-) Transcript_8327:205-492(-)
MRPMFREVWFPVGLKSCVPGSMIRNGAAAIVRATKNSPVLKGGKRGMGGPHHGTHEEQVPGNVPLEIGVGLALGIGAGIFVRNWTQNDIKDWAGK